MTDHRRILATLSFADDKTTAERLLDALRAWRKAATDFESPPSIRLPSPSELELETVQLPRDASSDRSKRCRGSEPAVASLPNR